MKKFLLFLASFFIGIALFVWVLEMVGWQGIKNAFLIFTGWHGLVILGLTLLMALVGTWKWKVILAERQIKLSLKSLLGPYLAGYAIMFLAPILIWGGEIFRSYILREKKGIAFTKGVASVVIDRILEWVANLTVIFFGGIYFFLIMGLPLTKLCLIFGGVFLLVLLFVVFFFFKSARRESIIRFFLLSDKNHPFEVEKEIFDFFKLKKLSTWKAVGLSFLRAAIMYLRAWFLILFLGKNIGALSALSILGFSYLAAMIPIPTALGSHEAIQTYAFASFGLGIPTATAFTMVIRGAELIVSFFGLIFFFRLGIILFKDFLFKKIGSFIQDDKDNNYGQS